MQLERGPLSAKEFKAFAQDVVLFCHITTHIPGRKHDGLLKAKGGSAFPTVMFLDDEGKPLNRPRERTVEAFRAGAAIAQAYVDLKHKPDKTPAEQLRLLQLQIFYGTISSKAAAVWRARLKLDAASDAALAKAITGLQEREVDQRILAHKDKQKGAALGKTYWTWYQNGLRPTGKIALESFYFFMMEYGFSDEQLEPVETGLAALKAAFPHAKVFFQQQDARLQKLRARVGR